MNPLVAVEGDGIASVCVARLLRDAGVPCIREQKQRPKVAAILLSQATQHLLREIFPASNEHDDVFEGFLPIRRRIVLWGNASEPVDLPHLGIVAPEEILLQRLWQQTSRENEDTATASCQWHVRTLASPAVTQSTLPFGQRHAYITVAQLLPSAPQDACWVESVNNGWLFLLPRGEAQATLMAVGDEPTTLLQNSRLISNQLDSLASVSTVVPASPQLAAMLAEPGTIACGSAAMSFDPLCGEGAGNAVREAFLAAAVVRAALQGHPVDAVTRHYEDRLRRGFARHLETCLQFYQSGGTGMFWQAQVNALHDGMPRLAALLAQAPSPSYRLVERDLVPINT